MMKSVDSGAIKMHNRHEMLELVVVDGRRAESLPATW